MTGAVSVLLVDNDHEMLHALEEVVHAYSTLDLAGSTDDIDSAIDLALTTRPDVALIDYKMPRGGGPRLARELQRQCPQTKIVALSAYADRAAVTHMLRAGAVGYLVKGIDMDEIESALLRAASGEVTLSAPDAAALIHTLAQQLDSEVELAERREELTRRIQEVVSHGELRPVYQPIVELASRRPIGFEALARFAAEPARTPDLWFAEASAVGLAVPLEREALRVALLGVPRLSNGQFLSVNLSPSSILDEMTLDMISESQPHRLVVEITEHAPIDDYAELLSTLDALRARGLRLAVDDAGAGYASLRHLLELRPELIKLDMSLTRGIDHDFERRALSEAFIAFSRATNTTLIAEGIETAEEERVLRGLGIRYGQGFRLGKPSSTRLPAAA